LIDRRDFPAAKRRLTTGVMMLPGPKGAFGGGADDTNDRLNSVLLDKVRAKHPDMVLLHDGAAKGAEPIASA
jgi:YspA, cpYpsA-related SLOG family